MTEDEVLELIEKEDEKYQKMKTLYMRVFPHRDFEEEDEKHR